MVKELDAIKIYENAESGNTARRASRWIQPKVVVGQFNVMDISKTSIRT